jgi:hypothetical protein
VLWPQAGETEASTGPGDYEIKEFFAVWIETLYFNANANANACDTVHSPDEDFTPPGQPPADCVPIFATTRNCGWSDTGNARVEGMLAFAIDLDMLPTEIKENFPGITGQRDYALIR